MVAPDDPQSPIRRRGARTGVGAGGEIAPLPLGALTRGHPETEGEDGREQIEEGVAGERV